MFRTISIVLLVLITSCKKDQLPVNLQPGTRANSDQVDYLRTNKVHCLFTSIRDDYNRETQRFEGCVAGAFFGDPARNMFVNVDIYNGGYRSRGAQFTPNVAIPSVHYGNSQMKEFAESGDVHYLLSTDYDLTLPEVPVWRTAKNDRFGEMSFVLNRGFPEITGDWAVDTVIKMDPDFGFVCNPWKLFSNCDSIAIGVVSDPGHETEIRARVVGKGTAARLLKSDLQPIRNYSKGYLFFVPFNYGSQRVDGMDCAFLSGLYLTVPLKIDTLN